MEKPSCDSSRPARAGAGKDRSIFAAVFLGLLLAMSSLLAQAKSHAFRDVAQTTDTSPPASPTPSPAELDFLRLKAFDVEVSKTTPQDPRGFKVGDAIVVQVLDYPGGGHSGKLEVPSGSSPRP